MAVEKSNRWEADRMQALPFSGIRKVLEASNRLRAQGVDIIDLALGRPDFDTPVNIKKAAQKALDEGQVHYTSNYGIPQLTKAIAKKLKADNNLEYDPAAEIMVTVGACEAVYAAMASFLNPGDEVIVPAPGWLNYVYIPGMLGATAVTVPLKEENNFALSAADVAAKISPKTKMLILVSPQNPTGGVVPKSELQAIAELAKKHDFLVLADEVYEKIIYDGNEHVSIGSLPGMKERTISINAASKTYSMTGWRIGWIGADKKLMGTLIRNHQYLVTCATSFAQFGALEALEGSQSQAQEMVAEFKRRRDLVVKSLNNIPGIKCTNPSGAFYAFANIKGLQMSSMDASTFFLEKANVATVPGSAFGEEGEGYVRVSYCNSYENIQRGMEKLKEAVKGL
ncbi:MAG TPA: pyridoxal phosphate-dependent aminotransferase [Clostridia bacterium]|nr:pyridoxal phosphate-dependent aminotransferase [Clostridia bacterium]